MSLDVALFVEVDTGADEPHRAELFEANITHNLGAMARAAEIYDAVWHPDVSRIECAGDLIEPLERGIDAMKADPAKFKGYNAPNGWGLYDYFVPWLEAYLAACKAHPKAKIWTWR